MKKIALPVLLVVFFLTSSPASLFSRDTSDKDNNPASSQDISVPKYSSESTQIIKEKEVVPSEIIEKTIPSYRMRLKEILKKAEENIKKVDRDIKEAEIYKRNQGREQRSAEAFERGNQLYKNGKPEEAREEWNNALSISKDPEMRGYIEEAERRAGEKDRKIKEEDARKREDVRIERERQEAAVREKSRIEKEAAREAERISREKTREEKERLEAEEREARRKTEAEAEHQEAAQREKARQEREVKRKQKEEDFRLEKEAREKVRIDRVAAKEAEAIK